MTLHSISICRGSTIIPESRFIFGGRLDGARRSKRTRSTSRSIGQPLADNTPYDKIGAGAVVNAEPQAVVVPEVELSSVAVQMGLPAMLVDADHSPLEDAVEAFDGVGVDFTAPILACAVPNEIMFSEVLREVGVLPGFIGHDVRAAVNVGLDDRQQCLRRGRT
jgi:hypothetical protein